MITSGYVSRNPVRRLAALCLLCAVAGCSTTPPRPPECSGPLVPINGRSDLPREDSHEARPVS